MKQNQRDAESTYQTGSTNPPKNHHNVIAVLLIVIAVLCSVVTVMGMMNIRLTKLLESQEEENDEGLEQVIQVDSQPQIAAFDAEVPVLGLTCQEMDNLYRIYHRLPQGLYVSQVESGSCAHRAGLQAGDIIVSCDGTPMTKKDRFSQYVGEQDAGTIITLTVFRDQSQLTVILTA